MNESPDPTATTRSRTQKKAGTARGRTQKTPEQRAAAAAAQQERLVDLLGRLDAQVQQIRTGQQWTAWLRCAAKFHSYSFNNTVAILLQRPDATQVAGYQTWQSLGRQVRKGEKGIEILAPVVRSRRSQPDQPGQPDQSNQRGNGAADPTNDTRDTQGRRDPAAQGKETAPETEPGGGAPQVVGVTRAHVFDLSQTEGAPLPQRPRPSLLPGQAPEGLWDGLAAQVAGAGFTLRRSPCGSANGVTDFTDRTVTISDRLDELVDNFEGSQPETGEQPPGAQACKTLAHELAHVLMHDPSRRATASTADPGSADPGREPGQMSSPAFCRGEAEVEAESVAFLVASEHGLATDDYSFAYVAGWLSSTASATGGPGGTVQTVGKRVMATAHAVLDQMSSRDTKGRLVVSADLVQLRERATAGAERTATAVTAVATAATSDLADLVKQADMLDGAAVVGETAAGENVEDREDVEQVARVLAVLEDTQSFYTAGYPDSWASLYLEQRFGIDVALDPAYGFGLAPAGWTGLTDHLRGLGHADGDLEAAGVCVRTRRDTLVDRFRDRVTLPLHDTDSRLVSFTARLNPAAETIQQTTQQTTHEPGQGVGDLGRGVPPKYLNGPDTVVFHKTAQLYGPYAGPGRDALARGARVVLVEGGFDAVAVTAGTGGRAVGVAPCGTALTDTQAAVLRELASASGRGFVVATDADPAGQAAAERAFLALNPQLGDLTGPMNPRAAALPAGADPAAVLQQAGEYALVDAIENGPTLASAVVDQRLTSREPMTWIPEQVAAARYAAAVAALDEPWNWSSHIDEISRRTRIDPTTVHEMMVHHLAAAVHGRDTFQERAGDALGRLTAHDQRPDLDRGLITTSVSASSASSTTTPAARTDRRNAANLADENFTGLSRRKPAGFPSPTDVVDTHTPRSARDTQLPRHR